MDSNAKGIAQRWPLRIASAVCAAIMAVSLCLPAQALAYFSKDPVQIYFGSTYLSMTTGSSNSVGLTIDPASEEQLPGCGMSICPQACNGLETPEGVMGGCLNERGWCTCAGTAYYTANTQVSVSSSNPYVARASVNGGSLSITAVSAGTATITVYASLSKHVDNSASMTVEVSDPVSNPDPTPDPGGSSGDSTSGESGGGGPASIPSQTPPSSSPSSGGGSVSVSAAGASATAAAAAASAGSGEDEKKAVELEAEDGTKVIVAKASDAKSAAEELAKIAGTEGTCTFWSGGTLDSPAISWTFRGTDLSENGDLAFDPTVAVSKKGSGDVAKLLADVKNAIVMDFAHSGALPAPAEVFVRTSGVYADGTELNLYAYNEDEKKFDLVEEDIEVSDGYAVYSIDHCSVWALSDEDLAACVVPVAAAEVPEGQVAADEVNVKAQDGTPFVIGIGVVVAAAVIAAIVIVARRRRKGAAGETIAGDSASDEPAEDESAAIGEAGVVADEGAPGAGVSGDEGEPASETVDVAEAEPTEDEAGKDDDASRK